MSMSNKALQSLARPSRTREALEVFKKDWQSGQYEKMKAQQPEKVFLTVEEFKAALENNADALAYAARIYDHQGAPEETRKAAGDMFVKLAEQAVQTLNDQAALKTLADNAFGHGEAIKRNLQNYPDVGTHGETIRRALNNVAKQAQMLALA